MHLRETIRFIPALNNWKQWLLLITTVKAILFLFLHYELHKNGFYKLEGFFAHSGDTFSYLPPIRNFVDGGLLSACRMPGFLPIYGTFYYLFGDFFAKNTLVFLQLISDIISVYVLGLLAFRAFKNEIVSKICMVLYALSSFVSVYNHFGYADSFNVSFLIFALYFFYNFLDREQLKSLLLSGLFFCWSIFFRQISLIPFAVTGIILVFILTHRKKKFKIFILSTLAFVIAFVTFEFCWILNNYKTENKFIPLVKPVYECYTGYPEHQLSLLKLPIAWGADATKWGNEGEWFMNPKMKKIDFPFDESVFTSAYNLDSLENLRQMHFNSMNMDLGIDEREAWSNEISLKSALFTRSYISEHPISYHLVNRIKLIRKFTFPSSLDNLPLPARNDMNHFEFSFKSFYFLFLLAINTLGIIGLVIAIRKREILITMSVLSMLVFYVFMGWIEQRYFASIYPFMVVFTGLTLFELFNKFRERSKKELQN